MNSDKPDPSLLNYADGRISIRWSTRGNPRSQKKTVKLNGIDMMDLGFLGLDDVVHFNER
jgi:hypothetical protein